MFLERFCGNAMVSRVTQVWTQVVIWNPKGFSLSMGRAGRFVVAVVEVLKPAAKAGCLCRDLV